MPCKRHYQFYVLSSIPETRSKIVAIQEDIEFKKEITRKMLERYNKIEKALISAKEDEITKQDAEEFLKYIESDTTKLSAILEES